MTREEAIDILQNTSFFGRTIDDIDTAIDMAIQALEQEPCEMTAEKYRQKMIQTFHNADCDELIALVVLPTEKEFEHLGWLLEKHYKAKPEPCADAISRQAVMDCFKKWQPYMATRLFDFEKELSTLQSVTPQPKMGRWILQPSNKEQGERDFIWWKCSKCGQVIYSETEKDRREYHAYCGRCGIKMQEVEE